MQFRGSDNSTWPKIVIVVADTSFPRDIGTSRTVATVIDLMSPHGKFGENLLTHLTNEGLCGQQRIKRRVANFTNDAAKEHRESSIDR